MMSTDTEQKFIETTGGPAHPCELSASGGGTFQFVGLTIRDWFAGRVLPEFLSQLKKTCDGEFVALGKLYGIKGKVRLPELAALMAYAQADAMLAARKSTDQDRR